MPADRMTSAEMQRAVTRNGAIDQRALRNALGRFATGVTVVTTRAPSGKLEGITVNAFAALSLDPPLVLWSIRRTAPSLDSFVEAGHFAINVLGAHQHELARHFSTPRADKFATHIHEPGHGGCPVLADSLATFQCETANIVDGGDHLVFIGRVIDATYRTGEPLIFSGGEYCVPLPLAGSPPPSRRRA
jgi:flavin reductase (DIM6/NTAB) family NADH-FMN oxidoreductase RutF